MKRSHKAGLGFGITSGIITPLGSIVGLYSSTQSSFVIIGGVMVIALADAFSDSLGIHISKESDDRYTALEVWEATITTFLAKMGFGMSFIIPFVLFPVVPATYISISWAIALLSISSYLIARSRKESPWWAIFEHVSIATIVIIITYYVPMLIRRFFF